MELMSQVRQAAWPAWSPELHLSHPLVVIFVAVSRAAIPGLLLRTDAAVMTFKGVDVCFLFACIQVLL